MRFFIFVLCLVLVGCGSVRPTMEYASTKEYKNGYQIGGTTMKALIKLEFPNAQVEVDDCTYAICNKKWIEEKFSPYFKTITKDLEYNLKFDCEDFARLFRVEVQLSHNQSKNPMQAPIVGEMHFVQKVEQVVDEDVEYRHAINIVMFVVEEGFGFMFYEPIESKFIPLTKEQIDSIYYIRF